MHSAYITIATVLALLGASCGDDAGGLVEKRRDAELSARRARAAAPPEPQSDDLVLTAPPSRDGTEGAPTAELVFARAQQAIDAGNWIDLLHSIRPTTRAQWLRDLVVALAVVSTDDGTDHDVPSQRAKRSIRELATRDPFDSVVTVVGTGTVLFYLAEKGKNDKCKSILDALTFITTCLSVGYDDLFAKTPSGKAIASFVMTVGPQLTASLFDAPRSQVEREAADAAAVQRAVVERLDSILEALRAGPA